MADQTAFRAGKIEILEKVAEFQSRSPLPLPYLVSMCTQIVLIRLQNFLIRVSKRRFPLGYNLPE